MIIRYLFFFLSVLKIEYTYSQDINIDSVHGDLVTGRKTVNINNYNLNEKDAILNVNKYIDINKKISVVIGDNTCSFTSHNQLSKGTSLYLIMRRCLSIPGGEKIFILKLVNGKLKITCEVNGIDGKYIAKIIDNKLIPSKQDYDLYVADSYFELFDDYYIPVLQIELIKKTNSIYIGGAFNYDSGYVLISKTNGLRSHNWFKPILLFSQAQQDTIKYNYKKEALEFIKPIHE